MSELVAVQEGQILPASRGAWTDDEWHEYLSEVTLARAIQDKAIRIYQFSVECPRCQGGSYFAERMREWHGMSQQTASTWKRLGEELTINDSKFSQLTISDDWNAWAGVARASEPLVAQLHERQGLITRAVIKEERSKLPEEEQSKAEAAAKRKRPRAERAEDIRRLSAEGCRVGQIAEELGIQKEQIRKIARDENIALADQAWGKTHHIDTRRVVEATVNGVCGLAVGLGSVDGEEIDFSPKEASELLEQFAGALKIMQKLRRQLEKLSHD